jgi:hypothetical protein
MTNIEISQERINEILQRQSGLCSFTGKKFDNPVEESKIFAITPDAGENIDNLVAVWVNADFTTIKKGNEFITPVRKYHFPYANFNNYNDEEKYSEIENEVSKVKEHSEPDERLRTSINQYRNLLKIIPSLNMSDAFTERINDVIHSELKVLEERNAKIRNEINETSQKFFDEYKAKIEAVLEITNKWQNLRNARTQLMEFQKDIIEISAKISKNSIEEVKKLIAEAFNTITQRQISERENYEMECSDNYLQLKNAFDKILVTLPDSKDFSASRQELINAQKLISTKTLKRNQQEELYQMIRNGFELLGKNQEVDKTIFINEANENYGKLLPLVENAINVAQTTDTFKESRETLIAAQTSIKGITLTKEQRDDLYGKIRVVFEKINIDQEGEREHFLKESEENFGKLIAKINAEKEKLEDNPHFKTIRENLLTIQSEIKVWKLKTDNRNKLYEALKDTFKALDEKRNDFFDNQKKAKKSKFETLLKNLKDKLEKLTEAIEYDKTELEKYDTMNQDENSENKEEISNKIEILKSKISEKDKRIQETKERIAEIEE